MKIQLPRVLLSIVSALLVGTGFIAAQEQGGPPTRGRAPLRQKIEQRGEARPELRERLRQRAQEQVQQRRERGLMGERRGPQDKARGEAPRRGLAARGRAGARMHGLRERIREMVRQIVREELRTRHGERRAPDARGARAKGFGGEQARGRGPRGGRGEERAEPAAPKRRRAA